MKTAPLVVAFCLCFTFSNSQNESTEIVQDFIENFNNKDSIATLSSLHKNYKEYWNASLMHSGRKDFAHYFSWSSVMQEHEEIEVLASNDKEVIVNSTYYSDVDKLLGKMPYKCKKTYTLSKGKIVKVVSSKHEKYDYYQSKRKRAFIKFKNWLRKNHNLKREDFAMNRKDAIKMRDIVLEFSLKQESLANRD